MQGPKYTDVIMSVFVWSQLVREKDKSMEWRNNGLEQFSQDSTGFWGLRALKIALNQPNTAPHV